MEEGRNRTGDFLKKDVVIPLCARYLALGVHLRIETNAEYVLRAAQECFEEIDSDIFEPPAIRLRVWVDLSSHHTFPRNKPYFRGLGNLVFYGFDKQSSLIIDVAGCSGAGRFTTELARDGRFWRSILFPTFLTVVGASAGLTSLHCACVSWKGDGLLLAGPSGSGKSSLSLALAKMGLNFVSDDRTLFSHKQNRIQAWGLSPEMKQRMDATAHFPDLHDRVFPEMWNGESAFRFDPCRAFGVQRVSSCIPRWIVFLEQQPRPEVSITVMAPIEAAQRLHQDLHRQTPETAEQQQRLIEMLAQKQCFGLRYGGNPHTIAAALRDLIAGGLRPITVPSTTHANPLPKLNAATSDPLRRFRATPLRAEGWLMGKRICVETNSAAVLRQVSEVFSKFEPARQGSPECLWRIVTEPGENGGVWPMMTGFSCENLRYINIGQRNFAAVDLSRREAVGSVTEELARDEIGFPSIFLAAMLHLSAPALGLTPVSAACVASGNSGLLLFGPPQSGKTTSSYWASKLGLDFHSDQAAFLEGDRNSVGAWGGFWPAAFRPEAEHYLPELQGITRVFNFYDRKFLCMDRNTALRGSFRKVTPAACIFLERGASMSPRLIPVSRREVASRVLYDAGSQQDREAAQTLLGDLPSYRLLYGDDPQMAALLFRGVLLEARS